MKKYYKIIIPAVFIIALFIFIPKNRETEEKTAIVPASAVSERINYFALHGWEVEELFSKDITIPETFSESYEAFACIQDKQKLPLRQFKGKDATVYTYRVTNYSPENKNLLAELIVCENTVISSIIYAEDDINYMLSVQ